MAKIVHGLSALVALGAIACGSGDVSPNGVESIDCTQDDAYAVTPANTGQLSLSTQDQTFSLKRKRESGTLTQGSTFVGDGAYVAEVKLPRPRCAPSGNDLAYRLWTVGQYTRWGHGIDVAGAAIDAVSLGYEGISFWAKSLIDVPTSDITFTDAGFREPQKKPDRTTSKTAEDVNSDVPETPADLAARMPRPMTEAAVLRLSVSTRDTQVRTDDPELSCVDPGLNLPPPLQVQDGSDECYDAFTTAFYPPANWTFYTVPFSELRQTGWGRPVSFLDSGHITGLQFTLGPFADYDILIDEVGFYKRAQPQ